MRKESNFSRSDWLDRSVRWHKHQTAKVELRGQVRWRSTSKRATHHKDLTFIQFCNITHELEDELSVVQNLFLRRALSVLIDAIARILNCEHINAKGGPYLVAECVASADIFTIPMKVQNKLAFSNSIRSVRAAFKAGQVKTGDIVSIVSREDYLLDFSFICVLLRAVIEVFGHVE